MAKIVPVKGRKRRGQGECVSVAELQRYRVGFCEGCNRLFVVVANDQPLARCGECGAIAHDAAIVYAASPEAAIEHMAAQWEREEEV